MIFDKYVIFVTFVPWILLYSVSMVNNLNNKEYKNFNFKYLKKNFLKLFRIDTLFLIVVFYYFASFGKEFVDKYLFAVICIYLFVNSFYEKKKELKKGFFKDNLLSIFLLVILILIPFIFYLLKHDLIMTYKLMLIWYFLEFITAIFILAITKFLNKIFNK